MTAEQSAQPRMPHESSATGPRRARSAAPQPSGRRERLGLRYGTLSTGRRSRPGRRGSRGGCWRSRRRGRRRGPRHICGHCDRLRHDHRLLALGESTERVRGADPDDIHARGAERVKRIPDVRRSAVVPEIPEPPPNSHIRGGQAVEPDPARCSVRHLGRKTNPRRWRRGNARTGRRLLPVAITARHGHRFRGVIGPSGRSHPQKSTSERAESLNLGEERVAGSTASNSQLDAIDLTEVAIHQLGDLTSLRSVREQHDGLARDVAALNPVSVARAIRP